MYTLLAHRENLAISGRRALKILLVANKRLHHCGGGSSSFEKSRPRVCVATRWCSSRLRGMSRLTKTGLIFQLAPSFHGATLVSLLLNNHSRVASLADTLPTLVFDQVCGCREKVSRCAFWAEVRRRIPERGYSTFLPVAPKWFGGAWLNGRLLYLCAAASLRAGVVLSDRPFLDSFDTLVSLVRETTGKDIFLDGVKSVHRFLSVAASGRPVDLVLHTIRDPRGFVLSSKKNAKIRNAEMDTKAAISVYNGYHSRVLRAIALAGVPAVPVPYDMLHQQSNRILHEIFQRLGLPDEDVMRPVGAFNHWIGNSSLFAFDGRIRANRKYLEELSVEEQKQVWTGTERVRRTLEERYERSLFEVSR